MKNKMAWIYGACSLLLLPWMACNQGAVRNEILWQKSQEALQQKKFTEAKNIYSHIISQHQEDEAFAWYNIAWLYHEQEDLATSLACLYEAQWLAPRNKRIRNNLAFLHEEQQKKNSSQAANFAVSNTWTTFFVFLNDEELASLFLIIHLCLCIAICPWQKRLSSDASRFQKILKSLKVAREVFGVAWLLCCGSIVFNVFFVQHIAIAQPASVGVFSGPSTDTSIRFYMPHGSQASIKNRLEDWLHIELRDGKQGFVHENDVLVLHHGFLEEQMTSVIFDNNSI